MLAEVRAACSGGATVLPISTLDGTGLDAVAAMLGPGVTSVLLGASGVGKTTLVNRLPGEDRATAPSARIGQPRPAHDDASRAGPAAGGGVLIDTPGMRELQLWASQESVEAAFDEIAEIAAGCRFRDCKHAGETGCAVDAALEDGRLTHERVAALDQLRREQAWADTRRDHRLQRERKEARRRQQRELRRTLKAKGRG